MREKETLGRKAIISFEVKFRQLIIFNRFLLEIYENNGIFKYVDVLCFPKYTVISILLDTIRPLKWDFI